MAARENQGYLIAVIILVLLTLVLALAAFLGISKASENADKLAAAESDANFQKAIATAKTHQANILMGLVGDFGPSMQEVQGEMDLLNGVVTKSKLEGSQRDQVQAIATQAKAIIATHDKDMTGSAEAEEGAADKPTYRNKIVDLNSTLSKKINDYSVQFNRAKRAEADTIKQKQAMDKTIEAKDKTLNEALANLETEKERSLAKERELNGSLKKGEAQVDDLNDKYAVFQQKKSDELRELADKRTKTLRENEILKKKINVYEKEDFDRADGKIVKVASGGLQTVFIDLGSADGLTNNRTFAVYDSRVTNFKKDEHKAMIEVTRVCLLYTSPSPRDRTRSRMPSSA